MDSLKLKYDIKFGSIKCLSIQALLIKQLLSSFHSRNYFFVLYCILISEKYLWNSSENNTEKTWLEKLHSIKLKIAWLAHMYKIHVELQYKSYKRKIVQGSWQIVCTAIFDLSSETVVVNSASWPVLWTCSLVVILPS